MSDATNVVAAIRHLGKCLRVGKEIWMGIPAENVCIAAADEIDRLRALTNATICHCELSGELHVIKAGERGCELCEPKEREPLTPENVAKAFVFLAARAPTDARRVANQSDVYRANAIFGKLKEIAGGHFREDVLYACRLMVEYANKHHDLAPLLPAKPEETL